MIILTFKIRISIRFDFWLTFRIDTSAEFDLFAYAQNCQLRIFVVFCLRSQLASLSNVVILLAFSGGISIDFYDVG